MAFIHCGAPAHDPARMQFAGDIDWLSGRLTFARLDVASQTYGGRSEWDPEARQFLYTFRPATVDSATNALRYASDAVVVAAATLGDDGTRLGIRTGVANATELTLAARIVVTISLLGFADFRPSAECSPRLGNEGPL